jgi:hypothetical protein
MRGALWGYIGRPLRRAAVWCLRPELAEQRRALLASYDVMTRATLVRETRSRPECEGLKEPSGTFASGAPLRPAVPGRGPRCATQQVRGVTAVRHEWHLDRLGWRNCCWAKRAQSADRDGQFYPRSTTELLITRELGRSTSFLGTGAPYRRAHRPVTGVDC